MANLVSVFAVIAVLGLAGGRNAVSTDAPEATATVAPTKEAESMKGSSPTQIPETDVSDLWFELKEDGTIRIISDLKEIHC